MLRKKKGPVLSEHWPSSRRLRQNLPRTFLRLSSLLPGTPLALYLGTALTNLGIEPPSIDAWDYAFKDGRLSDTPPTT